MTVPANVGQENPSRYEWTMTTTPQRFLDNQTRSFAQGRAVGGSSILNGLCWTRASAADYDAWRNLGNPGWGWTDLLPYFLKVRVLPFRFGLEARILTRDVVRELYDAWQCFAASPPTDARAGQAWQSGTSPSWSSTLCLQPNM